LIFLRISLLAASQAYHKFATLAPLSGAKTR
jgi:hypothetical protein